MAKAVKKKKSCTKKRKSYKELYNRKDRAIKIMKDLSEFLLILEITESDILKTMLIRFAIESVEASRGSLLLYDSEKKVLKYYDTYVYSQNRLLLEDYSQLLSDFEFKVGQGICGKSIERDAPILVPDVSKIDYYMPDVDRRLNIEAKSVLCLPLKIGNDIMGVIELVNEVGKREFSSDDLEVLTIIANFASATFENARLFTWAIQDSLTELYNGHYFNREFRNELDRAKQYNTPLSLVIIDIDYFKQFNDTYGHQLGDEVLKSLADIIRENVRSGIDIPARYGGDEFVIVFPETTQEKAGIIANRLLDMVRKKEIYHKGQVIHFTLSIGVASYPDDADTPEELFEKADEALYQSKKKGRNAVTLKKEIKPTKKREPKKIKAK